MKNSRLSLVIRTVIQKVPWRIRRIVNRYYDRYYELSGEYTRRKYWEARGKTYMIEKEREGVEKALLIKQRELLVAELEKLEFENILEVGCEYGRNLKLICERFQRATVGVDFSSTTIADGLKFLNKNSVELILADAKCLPFVDNCFDVVFTWGVLMHIPPAQVDKAIAECARVAKNIIIHVEAMPEHYFYLNWSHDYEGKYAKLGLIQIKEHKMPVQTWEKENLHFRLIHKHQK